MSAARRGAAATPAVVLDTPALLQALMAIDGPGAQVRLAWQAGRLRPLVDRALVSEWLRALAWPGFGLSPADREELLADILPYAEVVPPAPEAEAPSPGRRRMPGPAEALARRSAPCWLVSPRPLKLPQRLRCRVLDLAALAAQRPDAAP